MCVYIAWGLLHAGYNSRIYLAISDSIIFTAVPPHSLLLTTVAPSSFGSVCFFSLLCDVNIRPQYVVLQTFLPCIELAGYLELVCQFNIKIPRACYMPLTTLESI